MIFTVLRVSGSNFPVDAFLVGRHLELALVWHRGEPSRTGRHETSGFNLALPDVDSWKVALPAIRAFLNTNGQLFEDLRKSEAEAVLDIGSLSAKKSRMRLRFNFQRTYLSNW